MRLLICGDRYWTDYLVIWREINALIQQGEDIVVVITGDAKGADTLGRVAARSLRLPLLDPFVAEWDKYQSIRGSKGNPAGPIRNQRMLDEGKPTLVLAFHSRIEQSRGTKDMINRATKAGIPVKVVKK